jgi:hypothetical protein
MEQERNTAAQGQFTMVAEPYRQQDNQNTELLLIIKVKVPGKVHAENLSETFNAEFDAAYSLGDEQPPSTTFRHIEQMFGYLSANSRRYRSFLA